MQLWGHSRNGLRTERLAQHGMQRLEMICLAECVDGQLPVARDGEVLLDGGEVLSQSVRGELLLQLGGADLWRT